MCEEKINIKKKLYQNWKQSIGCSNTVAFPPFKGQRPGSVLNRSSSKKNPLRVSFFLNSLLGVRHCGRARSFVFDVLQET